MDKEEAEAIAHDLLTSYGTPENEREEWQGFTSIMMVYDTAVGGQIVTKKAAEGFLESINKHPEYAAVTHHDMRFTVKRAWLEGDEESGRVMVEYMRENK